MHSRREYCSSLCMFLSTLIILSFRFLQLMERFVEGFPQSYFTQKSLLFFTKIVEFGFDKFFSKLFVVIDHLCLLLYLVVLQFHSKAYTLLIDYFFCFLVRMFLSPILIIHLQVSPSFLNFLSFLISMGSKFPLI